MYDHTENKKFFTRSKSSPIFRRLCIFALFIMLLYPFLSFIFYSLGFPGENRINSMTVRVNYSLFDRYFDITYPEFLYEIISAKFLFCGAFRPSEFLKLGQSNLNLETNQVIFVQDKAITECIRDIHPDMLYDISLLWNLYGNPATYFGSYSSLKTYIARTIAPKFSISTRLDAIYQFRYCSAGCLTYSKVIEDDIIAFYQHTNPLNTYFYIYQGNLINQQLPN